MVSAGMFLALYRMMKTQGKEVEEIGAFVYEVVERAYKLLPRFASTQSRETILAGNPPGFRGVALASAFSRNRFACPGPD